MVFLNKALLGAYGIGGGPLRFPWFVMIPFQNLMKSVVFPQANGADFCLWGVEGRPGNASKIIENWKNPYELGVLPRGVNNHADWTINVYVKYILQLLFNGMIIQAGL